MSLLFDAAPVTLPRYRIEGVLGTGPDGPVLRAVAERLGARPMAVRIVSVADPAARRLLRIHSEVVAGLDDDGLACVHDMVDVDETRVAIITAEAEDGTLADRLALGRFTVGQAVPLVRTLAGALAAAHSAGLTHRRLHAGNVLLTDGGPAITDLAQAAAVGRPSRTGDPAADDLSDLGRLAHDLVDGTDPGAAAYRSVCDRVAARELGTPQAFAAALALVRGGDIASSAAEPRPAPVERPAAATGRLGLVAAMAMVVGTVLGAMPTVTAAVLDRDRGAPAPRPQAATPTPSATRWSPTTAELTVVTQDGPIRYRIGDPGDALVVGDWDCDGLDTPGLYRPATGETFLFDEWAGAEALPATPGPVLDPGGTPTVRSESRCDRIATTASS